MMNSSYLRWHRLGRDAYLSARSQYFDKHMASLASPTHTVIVFVAVTLIFFALCQGVSFVYAAIIHWFRDKSETAQG